VMLPNGSQRVLSVIELQLLIGFQSKAKSQPFEFATFIAPVALTLNWRTSGNPYIASYVVI